MRVFLFAIGVLAGGSIAASGSSTAPLPVLQEPELEEQGMASAAGVHVTVKADSWVGWPRRLTEVVPLLFTVENKGSTPVRLRYQEFRLAPPVYVAFGGVEYIVDTKASQVVIEVGKSGLFSFLGHSHEVVAPVAEGTLRFDGDNPSQSSVRVEFDASALRVTGKGEPAEDVPEVQRTMEREVLEVSRFPRIAFASRNIDVVKQGSRRLELQIAGDLALHGVTKRQTADVVVDFESNRLTATGTLVVKQTDFGIEPVSAGAGTVRVKDEVEIHFTLVAVLADSARHQPT